jgi:hypothetical protein
LEDLIRNVYTLFDDQPSTSPPIPSPAEEATSTFPSDSFLGADLSQPSEVDSMGPTTRQLRLAGVTPSIIQSYFSSLPLDVALESSRTPPPTTLPGTLLGLPLSNPLVGEVETNSQEQVTPEVRGTEAMGPEALANSPPPEVVSLPPTSVTELQLRQSQLPPHHSQKRP